MTNIEGRAGFLQSAKKLDGKDVRNLQNEKLGTFKDLVINEKENNIAYAVLSHEGKLYPVPVTAFGAGSKTYTLDITKENLATAPTIDSLNSDQISSPDLKNRVDDFYSKHISANRETAGQSTVGWAKQKTKGMLGAAAEQKSNFYLCSKLEGMEVQNNTGKKIAKIEDIVFDVRQGSLAYALTSFGGMAGVGAKTAAVPWSAITLQPTERIARLDADEGILEKSVIPKNDLNKLNQPEFARQVYRNYGQEPYWETLGYVAPAGAAGAAMGAWAANSEYNSNFKADDITTVEGTVKSIDKFTPAEGAEPGIALKIEATNGKTATVQVAPESYYMSQNVKFNEGDKVTVTGSKTRVGLKSVIMATEIRKGSETLSLRSREGTPMWKSENPEKSSDMPMTPRTAPGSEPINP